MLDLRFVRENPDIVKQNIKNKFQDSKLPLVDEVISLDTEARATQKEADDLRASQMCIRDRGLCAQHLLWYAGHQESAPMYQGCF